MGSGLALSLLGKSVNQTGHETHEDGGNGPEVNGSVKENQAGQSNRQLVQRTNHGVSGGRSHTHTPGGTVRDSDGRGTGNQNGHNGSISVLGGEVEGKVSRRPVLENEGQDQQNWNGQQVVVEHGVEVLEVGQLDTDSHEQHKGGRGETVGEHPEVSQVQRVHVVGGLGGSAVTVGGKDRREDHQQERAQGHGGDGAAKPQNLTVSDQDDGQVLENGVDWDGQELQRLGGRVDHGHKQKGNRHPLLGLIGVEWTVSDDTQGLQCTDGTNTNGALDGQQQEVQVERVARKHVLVGDRHENGRNTVTSDRQRARVGHRAGTSER